VLTEAHPVVLTDWHLLLTSSSQVAKLHNADYLLEHVETLKKQFLAYKKRGRDTKPLLKHYRFIGGPVSIPRRE
jgi:hypothetical protein